MCGQNKMFTIVASSHTELVVTLCTQQSCHDKGWHSFQIASKMWADGWHGIHTIAASIIRRYSGDNGSFVISNFQSIRETCLVPLHYCMTG